MERSNEISSSEDEFDFELLNEEITTIHREFDGRENTSSSDDSDEVSGVRRGKIRIINSECDSDSDTAEDPLSDNSEWISCTCSSANTKRASLCLIFNTGFLIILLRFIMLLV